MRRYGDNQEALTMEQRQLQQQPPQSPAQPLRSQYQWTPNNNNNNNNQNKLHPHYIPGLGNGQLPNMGNNNGKDDDTMLLITKRLHHPNSHENMDHHIDVGKKNKKEYDDDDTLHDLLYPPIQKTAKQDALFFRQRQQQIMNGNNNNNNNNNNNPPQNNPIVVPPNRPSSHIHQDYINDGPWQLSVLCLFGIICVLIFLFLHLITEPTPHFHRHANKRDGKREKDLKTKSDHLYRSPYRRTSINTTAANNTNSIIRKKKKEDTWSEDEALPYYDAETDSETGDHHHIVVNTTNSTNSAIVGATVDPTALLYYSQVPQQQHRQRKQVSSSNNNATATTTTGVGVVVMADPNSPVLPASGGVGGRTTMYVTSSPSMAGKMNFSTSANTTTTSSNSSVVSGGMTSSSPKPVKPTKQHFNKATTTTTASAILSKNEKKKEDLDLNAGLDGFITFSPTDDDKTYDDDDDSDDDEIFKETISPSQQIISPPPNDNPPSISSSKKLYTKESSYSASSVSCSSPPKHRISSKGKKKKKYVNVVSRMESTSSFSSFDSFLLPTPKKMTTATSEKKPHNDADDWLSSSPKNDNGIDDSEEEEEEEERSVQPLKNAYDSEELENHHNVISYTSTIERVSNKMHVEEEEEERNMFDLSLPPGSDDEAPSTNSTEILPLWEEDMITPRTRHVVKKFSFTTTTSLSDKNATKEATTKQRHDMNSSKRSGKIGSSGKSPNYRSTASAPPPPIRPPPLHFNEDAATRPAAGGTTKRKSTATSAGKKGDRGVELVSQRPKPSLSDVPPLPLIDSDDERFDLDFSSSSFGGEKGIDSGCINVMEEDDSHLFLPKLSSMDQGEEEEQSEPMEGTLSPGGDVVPKVWNTKAYSLTKPPRSVSLEELRLVRMESGVEYSHHSDDNDEEMMLWGTTTASSKKDENNRGLQQRHQAMKKEESRRPSYVREQQQHLTTPNLMMPEPPSPLRLRGDNHEISREKPRMVSQQQRRYPPPPPPLPPQDNRRPSLHHDKTARSVIDEQHHHHSPQFQTQQQTAAIAADEAQKQAANQKSARQSINHVRANLTTHSDASSSLASPIHFDELQLSEIIGGGGFGQVWKANWRGTPVAVKLLTGSAQKSESVIHKSVLEEFAAEINMVSGMRHPNICLYMGACLDPPNRAIVTEFAANGSLWDALRQPLSAQYVAADGFSRDAWPLYLYDDGDLINHHSPFPPAGAWPWALVKRVASGAARGMTYLHSGHPPVLHRDLKSANLLLDESYTTKLCDFGLSRLKAHERSMTGNCGTVQWMAPEVLANHRYAEPADVYSFGKRLALFQNQYFDAYPGGLFCFHNFEYSTLVHFFLSSFTATFVCVPRYYLMGNANCGVSI